MQEHPAYITVISTYRLFIYSTFVAFFLIILNKECSKYDVAEKSGSWATSYPRSLLFAPFPKLKVGTCALEVGTWVRGWKLGPGYEVGSWDLGTRLEVGTGSLDTRVRCENIKYGKLVIRVAGTLTIKNFYSKRHAI